MEELDKKPNWSARKNCLSTGEPLPTKCEADRAEMVAEGIRLEEVNEWLVEHLKEMIQIALNALVMQQNFANENSRLRSEAGKTSSPIKVHPFNGA